MTPFEYVIVLISIILGLGITTILTGIANFIKHPPAERFYVPYGIWIVLVFVLHIHEWWESYSLKSLEAWKLPVFLFIILYPIALYILAHLLFPSDLRKGLLTRAFYMNNYPRIFICAIVMDIIGIIHNLFITGLPIEDQTIQFIILVILTAVAVTKNKNSVVHHLVAVFMLLVALIGLALDRVSLLV
jgi:hypothetical protein